MQWSSPATKIDFAWGKLVSEGQTKYTPEPLTSRTNKKVPLSDKPKLSQPTNNS